MKMGNLGNRLWLFHIWKTYEPLRSRLLWLDTCPSYQWQCLVTGVPGNSEFWRIHMEGFIMAYHGCSSEISAKCCAELDSITLHRVEQNHIKMWVKQCHQPPMAGNGRDGRDSTDLWWNSGWFIGVLTTRLILTVLGLLQFHGSSFGSMLTMLTSSMTSHKLVLMDHQTNRLEQLWFLELPGQHQVTCGWPPTFVLGCGSPQLVRGAPVLPHDQSQSHASCQSPLAPCWW